MITTKEIVQDLSWYGKAIWKRKFIILSVGLIFAVVSVFLSLNKPPLYIADKTFMVSDDEGGGGGVASILGQFGLGGMGGGNYNYQKILEIGTSNLILDQVLFEKAEIEDTTDFIANHIIRLENLHKNWNKDTFLFDFVFTQSNFNSKKGRVARKILESKLKGDLSNPSSKRLVKITFGGESSILKISGQTKNPKLSIAIVETLYAKLSKFYIDKSIERQRETYEQLENKADSIYSLLSASELQFARSTDFNRGLVLTQDRIDYARSMRDIEMYSTMYSEVLKNKETAQFLLNSQTPFFQAIDSPYLPLHNANNFRLLGSIILFMIGIVTGIIIIIGFSYYQKEIKPMLN